MSSSQPMTLATLATFRDPWEAHMLRSLLEAEGIPAEVADDQFIGMNWPLSTALGGARVRVANEHLNAARAVLEQAAAGRYRAELSEMFEGVEESACPKCGSRDIRRRPSLQQLLFGLIVTLTITTVKVEARRCKCRDCGARWRA